MDTAVATMRIARDMKGAEETLNEALIAQSELYATLLKTRQETRSDPFLGHEQLLRLLKSQQGLLAVSGDLARVHSGLSDVQQEVAGIRECPDDQRFFTGAEADADVAA